MNNNVAATNGSELTDVFEPSPKTKLGLRQFGLSPGDIIDLLREYNLLRAQLLNYEESQGPIARQEVAGLFNDKDFVSFCLASKGNLVHEKFCVGEAWTPTLSTVNILTTSGIPHHLVTGIYVSMFHMDSRGIFLGALAIDHYFIKSCRKYWMFDPVNPCSRLPKPIPANWLPAKAVFDSCLKVGMSEQYVTQKALEYRLYWIDAGGAKQSWDDHFKKWLSKKTGCVEIM